MCVAFASASGFHLRRRGRFGLDVGLGCCTLARDSLESSDSGVALGTSSRSGSVSLEGSRRCRLRGALPGPPCFTSSQASPRQAEDGDLAR